MCLYIMSLWHLLPCASCPEPEAGQLTQPMMVVHAISTGKLLVVHTANVVHTVFVEAHTVVGVKVRATVTPATE